MRKGLFTAIWIIWLVVIWFCAMVLHEMAFQSGGIAWLAKLLVIFWIIYLTGLWFEKTRITDTAWALLLGYAFGFIRMLDMIPNQKAFAHWLKFLPASLLGPVVLAFISIFAGILPILAKNIIQTHQAKSRVLGRDT